MEDDCGAMLNLYLDSEETNALFDSSWTKESVLCGSINKMADDQDDHDIQELFDGETNPEVDLVSEDDDSNMSSGFWGEESSRRGENEITDEEIANLRVSELNKYLRKVPWNEAARIRKRRRNLKNRGYALTCRLRKQQEHEDLINENTSLKKQVEDGKLKLLKVWKEKEAYKRKYQQLQQTFALQKQGIQGGIRGSFTELIPCR